LADAMQKPGLDLFQVFNDTGLSVARATGGDQQPWMSNSPISGVFFFVPPGSTVTIRTPDNPVDPEVVFWQSIRDGTDVRAFQAYLKQYPSGKFAALAKLKVAALNEVTLLGTKAAKPLPQTTVLGTGTDTRQEVTHRVSTTVGAAVRVAQYVRYNANCGSVGLPFVAILTAPSNGTVDLRGEPMVMTNLPRVGAVDCRGRTFPSVAIWYTPTPTFHGTDRFDYRVYYTEGALHDTALINVVK
jgi:hypothetical protein